MLERWTQLHLLNLTNPALPSLDSLQALQTMQTEVAWPVYTTASSLTPRDQGF